MAALLRGRAAEAPAIPAAVHQYETLIHDRCAEFLAERYPRIEKDEFTGALRALIAQNAHRSANKFAAALWELFEPDFEKNFDRYYKWHEKFLLFAFLAYMHDEKFSESYIAPYGHALSDKRICHVLEVGGGIPHGFLFHALFDRNHVPALTYIDLNLLHADFVEWLCRNEGISIHRCNARAAVAPDIPRRSFDFVFAKDIFEHVDRPDHLITSILRSTSDDAILALDLEHKGARRAQHISPDLPPLKQIVEAAGYVEQRRFCEVTLYAKLRQKS